MEKEAPQDSKKRKRQPKSPPKSVGVDKQIWLLTYGSSCPSITHEMLLTCGLEVDQCYTATWRESKYTLLHTERRHRLRKTGMEKVMQRLLEEFKIVGTELFGFDSLSCNSRADGGLEDHPGFRILVEQVNQDPVEIEWWLRDGALHTNRKGLLWKHLEVTDPSLMTRAQLVHRVRTWAPLADKVEDRQAVNTFLNDHIATLTAQNNALAETLKDERAFVNELLAGRVNEAVQRSRV